MRTLFFMVALFSFSASYAARVSADGEVLSVDEHGAPVAPPWTLTTEGVHAPLPGELSIGGRPIFDIAVYPQGILVFDAVGFDAGAPRPLGELLMESAVAPLWTALAVGDCAEGPPGTVERSSGPSSLTVIWRDVPTAGCADGEQRATFSVTLGWDERAVVRRLEFRYEALPLETLESEPRAGLHLLGVDGSSTTFELLPDPDGGRLRGRAKLLLEGTSDGESGAWIIELGDGGQIVGELEPDHLDRNGQPRRPDGWREADNCPIDFNPLQEDLDDDGEGDVCDGDTDGDFVLDEDDNCPRLDNDAQADLDGDGEGDACDEDDDGDGWPDAIDLCPTSGLPSNGDLDRDGLGDVCDPDPDADDPWARAFRRFGIDWCPLLFDPLRMDRDRDGLGDACDLRPDVPCIDDCIEQADTDGDRISDALDRCPLIHDPRQLDTDGDGRGNACDPDANGDGVVDAYQVCQWGLCAGAIDVLPLAAGWSL